MSEASHIAKQDRPFTRDSITRDLTVLGVAPGDVIMVHTAFGKVGWISGGLQAFIEALSDAVGEEGTIVMTSQSGHLSDPATWENPPVPNAWNEDVRNSMPAYDPGATPTRGQGAVPEYFRTYPGVLRSAHPSISFTAKGVHAAAIIADHTLEADFGNASPLGRLELARAKILLVGLDFATCTALHLAETRAQAAPMVKCGAPMMVDGARQWVWYQGLDGDSDDFAACGAAFEVAHPEFIRTGMICKAESRLVEMAPLVKFATSWFPENREVLA